MSGNQPNSSYDQCEVDDMQKRVLDGEFDGRDEPQCDHNRDYCEYLEMKEDVEGYDELWCNLYQKLIDEINFGDCKFTVKENLKNG